jgi:glycosyltransferase involved in cell wall biosynthesis
MKLLVQYGNLVLLSIGENGTPLVIKEALMAGLPIVTNKYNIDDIDIHLSFIDIIPDDKLHDLEYVQHIIEENRKKQSLKPEIREYAIHHFSWKKLVKEYVDTIINI